VTDQPDPSSGDIPEVIPTEHIAPETPPVAPDSSTAAPDSLPDYGTPNVAASASPVPVTEMAEDSPVAAPTTQATSPASSGAAPAKRARPAAGSQRAQPVRTQRSQANERFTVVTVVSAFRSLIVTFAAAVIVATIFMWWTSPDVLSAKTRGNLAIAQATAARSFITSTALPTPIWFNRIGVIAGHSGIAAYGPTKGNVDPGTVCPDGFTEASVTMNVAKQVVATLQGRGFTVDLLQEWDPRLEGYQAAAFISLHADSCDNFNDGFNHTGFKATYGTQRFTARERDEALNECMRQNYSGVTGLPFTPGSITTAMTDYHAFHQIAPSTPAVILELGFLSYDRDLLQNHTDKLTQGVVNGFLCFLTPSALATNQAPTVPAVPTATRKP
jgi:N-acetylmuramoyl-L-alanine amidase